MKAMAILLAALLGALATSAQTSSTPTKGTAVLKKNISIPDTGTEPLPRLEEKQVVPCLKILDDGYLVVCHDAGGKDRAAFMANRDEWGHQTAKTWIFDSTLASNTLTVLAPASLKPGWIPLERGARFPVVNVGDNVMTILFALGDFAREISVAKEDVELLPPPKPETDPVKIREQQLAQAAEQAKAQIETLQKRLETARGNATRLTALHRELGQLELEKNRVKAEILKAEAQCKEMMAAVPPAQQPVLTGLSRDAERMAQQQADFEAKLEKVQLEAEPLKTLQGQLATAEAEIEKAKAAVRLRNAELEALQRGPPQGEIKQDKEAAKSSMDSLSKQNAEIAGQIQQLDLGKASLKSLLDRLEAVQQDNQQLRTLLQTLTTELQELQKKLRELQKPPAAEQPAKNP